MLDRMAAEQNCNNSNNSQQYIAAAGSQHLPSTYTREEAGNSTNSSRDEQKCYAGPEAESCSWRRNTPPCRKWRAAGERRRGLPKKTRAVAGTCEEDVRLAESGERRRRRNDPIPTAAHLLEVSQPTGPGCCARMLRLGQRAATAVRNGPPRCPPLLRPGRRGAAWSADEQPRRRLRPALPAPPPPFQTHGARRRAG